MDEDRAFDGEPDDLLEEAMDAFKDCEEAEEANRKEALDDIKFARLSEQWPEAIRKQRDLDGRPYLTMNRMPTFIRQVVNDGRLNRPSMAVRPVDSDADPETAEVMSDLIRNIETSSSADLAYDTALDSAVTGGFGYFRIGLRYVGDRSFDQEITIDAVPNPFSIYGDPRATAVDGSDWNVAFSVAKLSKREFRRRFKGAEEVDWSGAGYQRLRGTSWWEDDGPLVAEYWRREEVFTEIVALTDGTVIEVSELLANKELYEALGVYPIGQTRKVPSHKVCQHLMTGAEVLETVEWAGKFIPIVPVYGEQVNLEGTRYFRSLIRDAKDAQRMSNYWRTSSTELVALAPKAPFIGAVGAFDTDADKWDEIQSATIPYVEYDPVPGQPPPQRQPFAGIPAGVIQEALNASDDMKTIIGIHDASLGARSNETSGKAILARQREGDVSTFHFIDNLSRGIKLGGRMIIDLIPKVYSTARILRVVGIDGKVATRPVNQPYIEGPDGPITQIGNEPVKPGENPVTIEGGETRLAIAKMHDFGLGQYDLAVDTGPSFTTRREEVVSQMMELIRVYPDAAAVIGDILAQNLDWPQAEEIAKRLKAILPPAVKAAIEAPDGEGAQAPQGQGGLPPDALQQLQEGMQRLQQLEAENAQLKADRTLDQQKIEIDAKKAETERFKAETDRIAEIAKAQAPAIHPMIYPQPGAFAG